VTVHVELLFWEGCPSHPKALAALRAEMEALELDPRAVDVREIKTDEQARKEGFVGSPTIRIDGIDVVDPGTQPPALACRIYRRRDGTISPTPDPADVRDALSTYVSTATAATERSR
jgi:hypothetical protein